MAKYLVNINVGDKVRQCASCGTMYSNHLSSCPHCGGTKYNILEITPQTKAELERE